MAKDRMKFSDSDFQLTKLVALGVTVLTAIVGVVNPVWGHLSGVPLEAEVAARAVADEAAAPGVNLLATDVVTAQFLDAGWGEVLASVLPAVLFVVLMGLVTWLLWGLLDDVKVGRPFTRANVQRMRAIAAVIVLGAVVLFFVQGLVNGYLTGRALADSELLFANETSLSDLLLPGAGFLIAALAEAFNRGVQLEADVEGLV